MLAHDLLGRPGVLVPPMTPFTPEGEVDLEAFGPQIDHIVEETPATAVELMAVAAQEYGYLSWEDRRAAIRAGAEAVDGRLPVVVGISSPSVRRAVEFADVAEAVDADAVQALIPDRRTGGREPFREIVRYFEVLDDDVDRPIVAYHNPTVGADLGPDQLVELAGIDGVVAFKESSRNLRHVLALAERVDRAGLAGYYTTMEMTLITLLMGGSGVTTPAPPAVLLADLLEAFEEGDVETCVEAQRRFARFPVDWLDHGFPTVMKAALAHMGIDAGVPYPPTPPIAGEELESLEATLSAFDLG